jgi:hypothetical protein
MSLDFYIKRKIMSEVYWGNMTHNVSTMWVEAGIYDSLYNSHGLKAGSIIFNLEEGLQKMTENPEKYKKLEPDNGWGTYDGAIKYLEEIILACKNNKKGIIHISK